MSGIDLDAIAEARQRLRDAYLSDAAERPESTAKGIHHMALLSSDVERTIQFYQDLLEFPLTNIFENRDYQGSNHFFFDIGNGNALAFFDFPDLDLAITAKSSAVCITSPFPWSRGSGSGSKPNSMARALAINTLAVPSTLATRMACAWN